MAQVESYPEPPEGPGHSTALISGDGVNYFGPFTIYRTAYHDKCPGDPTGLMYRGCADLSASIRAYSSPPNFVGQAPDEKTIKKFANGETLWMSIYARNLDGPDFAYDVKTELEVPSRFIGPKVDGKDCTLSGGWFQCNIMSITPNNSEERRIITVAPPGEYSLSVRMAGSTPDPIGTNNTYGYTFTIYPLDSALGKWGAILFSGSASTTTSQSSSNVIMANAQSPLKQVEVAVARPAVKSTKFPDQKKPCQWLKNKNAQFRKVKPTTGVCDKPIWLKATGTTKWRFKLDRPLPPGRYVVYARATNKDRVSETQFTVADKNRENFTVKG